MNPKQVLEVAKKNLDAEMGKLNDLLHNNKNQREKLKKQNRAAAGGAKNAREQFFFAAEVPDRFVGFGLGFDEGEHRLAASRQGFEQFVVERVDLPADRSDLLRAH